MSRDWINSEVQYMAAEGGVHSDLPPADRAVLHSALDEWLNKANGTGFFYIGNIRELREEFTG